MIYFIIGIVAIVVIGVLLVVFKYLKLRDFNKIIETCTYNINDALDRQEKEMVIVLEDVKDQKIKEAFVNIDSSDMFCKEELLFNVSWSINKYFEENDVNDNNKKILRNINNIEEELEGLKDYYNLNASRYNELYNKIPFVYIFRLLKLNSKKIFKIRKLENYEILKD